MKLLIITQVIDTEHPILGFFHRWVEEFAKHCEQVHVICLYEGKHSLPANVTVHSLGKEEGMGKFVYLFRFYSLIWKLRHEYNNVFVHMNQIYVILGAPFWRAWGKRVGLWYAHGSVTWTLRLAVHLVNIVFTSTEQGMRIDTQKRKIVGQGIDLANFSFLSKEPSKSLRLITVGRISQSKNIDTLLKSCAQLNEIGIDFNYRIVGSASTAQEEEYEQKMRKLTVDLNLQNKVVWVGPVLQPALPEELRAADVFIHDGATNSLDKVLLEAVLCGCLVLSSNPAYLALAQPLTRGVFFEPRDAVELTKIIMQTSDYTQEQLDSIMEPVRGFVFKTYSIENLISGIVTKY